MGMVQAVGMLLFVVIALVAMLFVAIVAAAAAADRARIPAVQRRPSDARH